MFSTVYEETIRSSIFKIIYKLILIFLRRFFLSISYEFEYFLRVTRFNLKYSICRNICSYSSTQYYDLNESCKKTANKD